MTLYLVRHATAGKRGKHDGPDLERPLDSRGREQADKVAELLGGRGIEQVLSSRALRCIDTVRPLADSLGLEVETHPALLEEQSAQACVTLVRDLAARSVEAALCSHGDIIPDVIEELARQGLSIVGHRAWAKGSTWQLETRGTDIVEARFLGPF